MGAAGGREAGAEGQAEQRRLDAIGRTIKNLKKFA